MMLFLDVFHGLCGEGEGFIGSRFEFLPLYSNIPFSSYFTKWKKEEKFKNSLVTNTIEEREETDDNGKHRTSVFYPWSALFSLK